MSIVDLPLCRLRRGEGRRLAAEAPALPSAVVAEVVVERSDVALVLAEGVREIGVAPPVARGALGVRVGPRGRPAATRRRRRPRRRRGRATSSHPSCTRELAQSAAGETTHLPRASFTQAIFVTETLARSCLKMDGTEKFPPAGGRLLLLWLHNKRVTPHERKNVS